MPGFDRTGPLGQGPMTGRGMGRCGKGGGFGRGRGLGRGGGRRGGGFSRGFAGGFAWGHGAQAPTGGDEKAWLQDRLRDLEQESRELRERLASYESEKVGE